MQYRKKPVVIEANKEVKAVLADSISDWSVETIKETPIVEVLNTHSECAD